LIDPNLPFLNQIKQTKLMKNSPFLQKLKSFCKRASSFLLLFQRSPAAQIFLPEVNMLSSVAAIDATKLIIATVVGLGAYDSVAGATTVGQVSPSNGSTIVPVNSGVNFVGAFQVLGAPGQTPQSWSITSGELPSGLTLSNPSARNASITGTTTQVGDRAVTITAWENSNFSGISASGSFIIRVTGGSLLAPVLQPIVFPTLTIGADFSFTVTALNSPKTFIITGLPLGLKVAPTTGVISGRPLVSGLYNVQVRAINTAGASAAITTRLVVRALDKNLVGTFGGTVARDATLNQGLGGSLLVTTTSLGSYTVKLVGAFANSTLKGASTAYTMTGNLAAVAPQISGIIGGQSLSLTLDAVTGEMTCKIGPFLDKVKGWRLAWNALNNPADTRLGYYSMALDLLDVSDKAVVSIPQGSGFATFNASLAGGITTVGKTADGETFTSASFLSGSGDFWAYSPLYKNGGSILSYQGIQAGLKLAEDTEGLFANNFVNGELTWFKPAIAGRAYPNSFGPTKLKVEGGYLAPSSKGSIVLGLPDPGMVNLSFTDGGLASSATDPDMNFLFTDSNTIDLKNAVNPGKVAITLNTATGAVAGSFNLAEPSTPPLVRSKVAFQGQVVRFSNGSHKAVGYFMLPQIPIQGQTATATAILSGGFNLQ